MIEIYLLEALCALYDYGTLSAAAEHLHISQPALSRSMQKLEDLLGVSLFDRTKNRITLNETGRMAAVMSRRILESEEDMITAVRNYDSSLHTVSAGYCTPGPMMEMPLNLTQIYPKMKVSSEMENEEALLKGLKSGKYGFVILSHAYEDEDTICIPCGSESLYFSLIPAHPAALFKNQGLSFSQMNGETFVMAGEIGIWRDLTMQMMPDSKFVLQDSLEALTAVINASTLPAFASDLTIRLFRSRENSSRIFIKITDPEATMHYHCVILKKNRERYERWITFLEERFAQ
ncbi:MAG: LysR family transcriptional regulator [Erysipelotrichaceae bacterium]|nr:LysR family transcriptional regulator [Erysipelotrichaceae bacterium]